MGPFPSARYPAAALAAPRHARPHQLVWRHRFASLLAVLAGCGLFLSLMASPAVAHDRLKSSSPKRNAELSGVERIELEYSNRVRFPAVVLRGPEGKAAIGKPRLDGRKALVDVTEPLPPGRYVIGWRVVSLDGHPIEGEIPFTVTAARIAPPPSSSATPSPAASPSAVGAATAEASDASPATATPAAGSSPAETPSDGSGWLWAAAGLVAIAAAVWFGGRGGRQRRQGSADPDADPDSPAS